MLADEAAEMAFRHAFAQHPLDVSLRHMYADWLMENDQPEKAAYYQRWTEATGRAEVWLKKFATRVGLTYDQVIKAAIQMAEKGIETGSGMNFEPSNLLAGFTHKNDHEPGGLLENIPPPADGDWLGCDVVNVFFWKQIEAIIGKPVPKDRQNDDVFLCCEFGDDTPEKDMPPWLMGDEF